MIALISFTDELVMPREEATLLKLSYEECPKVGMRDGKLRAMQSGDYYRDEITNVDGKYFAGDKEVNFWYIYDRPTTSFDWVKVSQNNHLVDLAQFVNDCMYPFTIKKATTADEPNVLNIQHILAKLDEKTRQIDKTMDMMSQQTFNPLVNVHVGGGLIVTYNDLCLKENCCTDILQTELNDGWRIIAVCVQPDQRRPDYILVGITRNTKYLTRRKQKGRWKQMRILHDDMEHPRE